MSWEEDTDEEKSEPGKRIQMKKRVSPNLLIMILKIVLHSWLCLLSLLLQSSFDRESKSDDYLDSDNFSDDDKDWEIAYKKLL